MGHIPLIGSQFPTNTTVRIVAWMVTLVLSVLRRMTKMTMARLRLVLMLVLLRQMLGHIPL